MTPGGIIACRLDSQRLPGKVLKPVCGRPLLGYVIARCRQCPALADRLVVATTRRPIDDPIEAFCRREGVGIYRGPAEDVAGRLLGCARRHGFDWFFRLNADSPFVDPALLNRAWQIAATGRYDFVTNLYPRSFPYGVSVELLRTDLFADAYRQMTALEHFEHATLFLYRGMDRLRYDNLARPGEDLSGLRLTVDTPDDLELFEQAVGALQDRWETFGYLDAVEVYEQARLLR